MTHTLLLYALPGCESLFDPVLSACGAEPGQLEMTRFPDGESYLRFDTDPNGRHIVFLARLNDPDTKLFSLLLAARTARDLGAESVGLLAPYMPYLRQDAAFRQGESVSARHIGATLSDVFSWVVTLDPHLHRLTSLEDVFSIPAAIATSTGAIAAWISENIESPIICGPDAESEQWVRKIAQACGAPHLVFEKTRYNANSVEVDVGPDIKFEGHTPVIVDDIISTGGTVISLSRKLVRMGSRQAICCVVHALFSSDADRRILEAGVDRVVSTNSISHRTNLIDVSSALAETVSCTFERYLETTNMGR